LYITLSTVELTLVKDKAILTTTSKDQAYLAYKSGSLLFIMLPCLENDRKSYSANQLLPLEQIK